MEAEAVHVDLGHVLDSATMERGLRELNPEVRFDPGGKLGFWHPSIETRQGVYYQERFVCGADRGSVPEFKVWNIVEIVTEGEWWEADKEGAAIFYEVVLPSEKNYEETKAAAASGSEPSLAVDSEGRVLRRHVRLVKKKRGRCLRVGWRHTFENLLTAGIPGITRDSLGKKFGVDMHRYPSGTPEEISAAVVEE